MKSILFKTESLENSSKEIATSSFNPEKEEPPQDFDIRKLIREECCVKVCEEQKQSMEDTMLELVKIFRQKEFLCIHDNVEDLIESDLNSKLLSINSQHLEKEQQEVKEVIEQLAERGNRIEKSLQNFRIIHKSSISSNTSQISSIHAVAPILSTKEPEYSPSMGYENSNTTLETESNEIMKSGVGELVPILSENEVTLEDKRECDETDVDADAEITLVDETVEDQGRFDDQEMFDTGVLDDKEVVVEKPVAVKEVDAAQDQVSADTTTIAKDLTVDDITLAKVLEALKTSKPKIREIVVRDHKEPSESTTIHISIDDSIRPKETCIVIEEPSEATTTTISIPSKVQDKDKGIMVEESLKMKKKDQISFDNQEARRLQAELDQEQRLEHRIAEEKAQKVLEANIVVIEQWHDVQAKIEADFELAQRIQAEEQE
nr:hypothetical protein [Tanacetum cinerariifolium]